MDNGIVERLHVRATLTRKNFLFAGFDAGGERAAMAYTILGCCRLVGADPVAYLADVLPPLARRIRVVDVAKLMPARWAARTSQVAMPSAPAEAPFAHDLIAPVNRFRYCAWADGQCAGINRREGRMKEPTSKE